MCLQILAETQNIRQLVFLIHPSFRAATDQDYHNHRSGTGTQRKTMNLISASRRLCRELFFPGTKEVFANCLFPGMRSARLPS